MRKLQVGYLFCIVLLWIMSSCSATKFVPEEDYLLDKVRVKADLPNYKTIDLLPYIRQRPNYKMFGLNKTQLQVYNLSGQDSTRWINKLVRRIGEPPVILDSTLTKKTEQELTKLFINKGYIHAQVNAITQTKGQKADITYYIQTNTPHRIANYTEHYQDSSVFRALQLDGAEYVYDKTEILSSKNSLIKSGSLFDRFVLDDERQRVVNLLRNRGYYTFSKDYVSFRADTLRQPNLVDLELQVHPYRYKLPNETYAQMPHAQYYINKVNIYTEFDPLAHANVSSYTPTDSLSIGNYTIYYGKQGKQLSNRVLLNNCFFTPGKPYSERAEEATYYAYSSLKALENVSVRFQEKKTADSTWIDCYILAVPAKRQNFSVSLEGTNSEGNLGFASSLGYEHRNVFKGSESFGVKLTGAYEYIGENFRDNYLDIGVQTSLNIPKFIFPFLSPDFKRRLRASTELALSYNYLTRPEFNRILLSGSFKYIWQNRSRRMARHQFSPIDINYVFLPRIDQDFLNNLPPNAALFSYTNQFIVGMSYSYTHSTFNPTAKSRDVHSFRASVETAGNALRGLSTLMHAEKKEGGSYALFGIHYAQFMKGDADYSKTIFVDEKNAIAWHAGVGIAYPYSNSHILPFEKRYYSGGANGVRGWSVRTLGPGSYKPVSGRTTFYEQSGDLRLDLSVEYRSHLFWKMELAAYVDAGNIWTIREYEGQEGGRFRLQSFPKEIALSYGLGIRLDFDFFLIRLDTGMKAYDPTRSGSDRWVVKRPNFGNMFAWHFAVGYPF